MKDILYGEEIDPEESIPAKILREEAGWKTIDSAPRDGTAIIAAWKNNYGIWRGVLHWEDDNWYRGEDLEELTECNTVTHWTHLPPPPESEIKEIRENIDAVRVE